MAWNYSLPAPIYPESQSSLSTGEGLGITTPSGGSPYERAVRNLYRQARRNRQKDPKAVVEAAALAEKEGFDVSGSITAVSQANARNRMIQETKAKQEIAALPARSLEMNRNRIRQRMKEAAAKGQEMPGYLKDEALAAGANPDQYDRAASYLKRTLGPKTPVVDATKGGLIDKGTTGKDATGVVATPGSFVVPAAVVPTLGLPALEDLNAGRAEVPKVPPAVPVTPAMDWTKDKLLSKFPKPVPMLKKGGTVPAASGDKAVPTVMAKGEYVVQKSAVDRYGKSFMEKLRNGSIRKDAKGRLIVSRKRSK